MDFDGLTYLVIAFLLHASAYSSYLSLRRYDYQFASYSDAISLVIPGKCFPHE
jgi:hypothetical protein